MADEIPQPEQQPTPVSSGQVGPSEVHVMSPDGELGTIDPSTLHDSLQNGYTVATPEDIAGAKYGSIGQGAIAGAEGAAQGATFGLSTGLETAAGVKPEDIRGRAEAHPIAHGVGQVAGLIGSSLAVPGGGEAGILKGVGEGAAEGLGLGAKGAGFVSQVGADTVKGAFEAALFQGGEEISKAYAQDPSQTAESAIANMGLASVMGGVFSGALGTGIRSIGGGKAIDAPGGQIKAQEATPASFISEMDRPAFEAGDFKTTIENSNTLKPAEKVGILDGLSLRKSNALEIEQAANRLNAPVLEGMTSDSKIVQKAEDSLLNGAPTYSGLKRQALYGEGYKAANAAVESALGEGSTLTKAELGNTLKDSITSQIKEQSEPISQMYNEIKKFHNIIPVAKQGVFNLKAELQTLPELRIAPGSPGSNLAKSVIKEIGNLKTVDDIKAYKSSLYDRLPPTSSPGEKRIAAIISDKLKALEDNSVESFAREMPNNNEGKSVIQSLVGQRKAADAQYKPFINKIQTLSEQLGKGRVHGAQDVMHFINDLTPESVTQKLFSKNNSEFLKFFSKNFPDQMEMMKAYQKGVLREGASTQGDLSSLKLFNKINKLEPEIQRSIFNKAELQKLQDAEIYLRSFPKNFNPSGTSGMSAFRAFFEHPTGAVLGNLRDLGIEKFIKTFGASPELNNANKLAQASISGWKATDKAIRSVLDPIKSSMPSSVAVSATERAKLNKLIDEHLQNPQKMMSLNDNNPVAAYSGPFSAASARAVQYLSAQKPNVAAGLPLDGIRKPSSDAQGRYDRALDLAQQPLLIMKHIKDGSITPQDVDTIKNIYPSLYNQLSMKIHEGIINNVSKGISIPYKSRLGLSLFLGQALDSTMSQQGILGAQPLPPQAQPQQGAPGMRPKHSTTSLNKLPSTYKTPTQTAESRRSNKN